MKKFATMIATTTSLLGFAAVAQAEHISFMEDNGCSGDTLEHFTANTSAKKSYGSWPNDGNNDEIRSVKFFRTGPGAQMHFYDERNYDNKDDVAVLTLKQYVRELCVNLDLVHTSPSLGSPTVYENDIFRLELWHDGRKADGKIAGKVSSWSITPGMAGMPSEVDKMYELLDAAYGWWLPTGSEYNYESQGHWFRVHRPDVRPRYSVKFMLVHNRGGAFDDRAYIQLETDAQGKPIGTAKINVQHGDDNVADLVVDVAETVAKEWPNKYTAAGKVAAGIADKVYTKLLEWTDFGGREVFKGEIDSQVREVLDIADNATPDM